MRNRGFQLPGILAIVGMLFVLFVALQGALRAHRYRLSSQKHEVAAKWLAVSGADLVEARIKKGAMNPGEVLKSPQFQQGRFEVRVVNQAGRSFIVSTGFAANKTVEIKRQVGPVR